nr:hypothetical protein [Trichoderma harzianum]
MDSIDSFDDIIRQRPLLNDVEVGVELVEVGCANDDGIAMLPIKNTVIHQSISRQQHGR